MADNSKMIQANSKFKKLQRHEEAKKNVAEHEASEAAIRAKTARLKALRLARDAALAAEKPVTPVPVKKKPAKKAKEPSVNLSDWLKDRQSGGHNN